MLDKVTATASILALIAFHDFVTTLRRNARKGAK